MIEPIGHIRNTGYMRKDQRLYLPVHGAVYPDSVAITTRQQLENLTYFYLHVHYTQPIKLSNSTLCTNYVQLSLLGSLNKVID